MERNSFSNSLGDHSVGNKPNKDNNSGNNNNNYKQLKDSWRCSSNLQGSGEDYLAGFSWPPRSYTCSFCKREFRSAQALGGHMNVHRRDRARLREAPLVLNDHVQPSFLNLDPKPNPNPNPSFSSVPSPSSYTLPLLVSPPLLYASNYSSPPPPPSSSSLSLPSSAFPTEMRKWQVNSSAMDPLSSNASGSAAMKGAKSLFGVKELKDYDCNKFLKQTSEYVRLDLDLEIGLVSDSKEDLDLELRLGYS